MDGLRFDDETHRAFYKKDDHDRELARATSALADVGIIDTSLFHGDGRSRGTRLHDAHRDLHRGTLAVDPARTDLAPYWRQLLQFFGAVNFRVDSVEEGLFDLAHGYAGVYDLFGQMLDLPDVATDLIDLKTGSAPSWVGLQTMGYARRLVDRQGRRARRWCLVLPGGTGDYRLIPLNVTKDRLPDRLVDKQHEEVFLASVRVWRHKRGL